MREANLTLKEKVEMARKALKRVENTSEAHLHYYVHDEVSDKLAEIDEVLTALEARVEELEGKLHDAEALLEDCQAGYEKEAPNGE